MNIKETPTMEKLKSFGVIYDAIKIHIVYKSMVD